MAYTSLNIQIFTAAYCGALAGMGLSDRQITDQSAASYAGLASVAGAYAQAVDTAWGAARSATLLDTEAIQSASQAFWQDRSPIPDSTNTLPATHASAALAMIATITAAESYYAAQGLTPPAIPGGSGGGGFPNVADLAALGAVNWVTNALANGYQYYVHTLRSYFVLSQTGTETVDGITVIAATGGGRWLRNQTFSHPSWMNVNTWYIDATNGNDENDGQAAAPAAGNVGPLKTHAELNRRWNGKQLTPTNAIAGGILQCKVNILTTLPATDPVNTSCIIGPNTLLWYLGKVETVNYSGTFTGVTALAAATNQALQLTDTAIVSWTTYLNKRWRITAGARQNFMGWVAKDLGANQCRSSNCEQPGNMNPAQAANWPLLVNGTVGTPQVGDTYNIETLTTISLGPINTQIVQGNSPSASSGKIIYGELAVRSSGINMTVNQTVTGATETNFYSCDLAVAVVMQISQGIFDNCQFGNGVLQYGGNMTVSCGLIYNANSVGLESKGGAGTISLTNDLLCQGIGIRGSNFIITAAAVFDAANSGTNPGGHGVAVGKYRNTNDGTNQVSWAAIKTRVWGSGNAGKGLFINGGCSCVYTNGIVAALTITGTGGDWSLNNGTTANVWDQTASAGAGGFLAPRNSTWANLAATVATTGFGNAAQDVATGARLFQAAA